MKASETNNNRIDYLDGAKGVGIIFVVVFHVIGSLMESDHKAFMPYVIRYIVTIALPIFFIVSGMLFAYRKPDNKTIGEVARRKAKALLTPYYSFSIICILIYFVQSKTGNTTIDKSEYINDLIYLITGRGFSVFWFLPTLFLAETLFTTLYKKCHIKATSIITIMGGIFVLVICPYLNHPMFYKNKMLLAIGSLALVAGRTLLAMSFLLVGYGLMTLIDRFKPTNAISIIIGIVLLIAQYFVSALVKGTNINVLEFGNSYFFFLSAIVGSCGVILLLKGLSFIRILPMVGKQSLIIMATHMDFSVLAIAIDGAYKLIRYIPRGKLIALYGLIGLFIILIEIVLIFIFNKFLYRLLGKDKLVIKGEKR